MVFLLNHILAEGADKHPEKEAIIFKDRSISYSELDRESNILAKVLLEIGVTRRDRVGIYLNRGISSVVGLFGILKSGAVYVPIDPLCPSNRLKYIVQKCGIRALLTTRERVSRIEQEVLAISSLKHIIVMNGKNTSELLGQSTNFVDWLEIRETVRGETPDIGTIDTDLAYILFTSGSTGNPKGVMISHLNSLTFINSAREFFNIKPCDRMSNICPLHFDMSVFDLFVALRAGATVVVIPETDAIFPTRILEHIANNRISVWNSVPSALSLLATYSNLFNHDLSSLRLILFAGELFPMKYLQRLIKAIPGARFCNMYGQTEANSSTYYWVDQLPTSPNERLPIGRPIPNFNVFALTEEGKQVMKPGEEGELYVRASSVAMGYWNETEKSDKSFVDNPLQPNVRDRVYKTGDLVGLDSHGNYIFLGRKDHMIKSRGYRIETGEIETVLCSHPDIKNAIVIPIPDELIGNRISALVVPVKPGILKKEDIGQYCSRQLPKYMIPEVVEFYESFPTTSSGKVDRQKLAGQRKVTSCQ